MSSATILFILRDLLHERRTATTSGSPRWPSGPGSPSNRLSLTPDGRRVNLSVRDADVRRADGRPRLRPAPARSDAAAVRHGQPPLERMGRRLPLPPAPRIWRRSGARRGCSISAPAAATSSRGSRGSPNATASTCTGSAPIPIRARTPSRRGARRAASEFRATDAATLVAEGERFDAVLSNHVLHHLSAPGLRDVRRRIAGARGRARAALRHPARAPAYWLYAVGGDALRTRHVPADRRAAVDPAQLPADELADRARAAVARRDGIAPFRVVAVGRGTDG